MFGLCFIVQYLMLFLVLQSSRWGRELIVLLQLHLMPCDCQCSVALPHGAMGWSAVCDGGISWSYPLIF